MNDNTIKTPIIANHTKIPGQLCVVKAVHINPRRKQPLHLKRARICKYRQACYLRMSCLHKYTKELIWEKSLYLKKSLRQLWP
jgi:hypothetical protein